MKELVIEATLENLTPVLDFVSEQLEAGGCDARLQMQIAIAVEEIYVNIARYAYHPEVGGVVVRVAVGSEVLIEFEDGGMPYNPLERQDPDIAASLEERELGGLGIFMVKKIMDSVEYKHDGNKNILSIKKVLV